MDKQRLWLRVTKDFTKEEHMMLLEIMAEQYGLTEDLMNTNVLEIIAARNESEIVLEIEKTITDLLDKGQKIAAIREYRAYYGAPLKDAKEAVEAIDLQRQPEF